MPPKTLKAIALIWASCCRVPNFHPFPCFSWKPPLGRKMAKKICEGVEKGSVKADIFEKSSYWYAILFFPLLHCSFNRGADLIATANKKKKKSQSKDLQKGLVKPVNSRLLVFTSNLYNKKTRRVTVRRELSSLNSNKICHNRSLQLNNLF